MGWGTGGMGGPVGGLAWPGPVQSSPAWEEGGDRIWPLSQILTSIPSPGGPNSASQSCSTNFGNGALSSPIWAAVCYLVGREINFLFPG